ANQNLESFSASVSHDLRAPLRRVIAFTGLLQKTTENSLSGEACGFMNTVVEESKSMDRLIRDLLEFARLGRAGLKKDSVDMLALVKDVISQFQLQLQGRTVVWKIGDLCNVFGDSNLLRYALTNLIDNALKYTRRTIETQVAIGIVPESSSEREATFFIK